jgi:hypothetical protein
VLGLVPNPEKSKVTAVKPRSASALAYRSGICSLTVNQEPVTATVGRGVTRSWTSRWIRAAKAPEGVKNW